MRGSMTKAGFTLIELMISVAIVGILASIAVPNFSRYQLKVKSAEARTLLGTIVVSEESFAAEYGNYAQLPATPAAPCSWPPSPAPTCRSSAAAM